MIKLMNSRDDFTGPVNVGNPNEFTIIESSKNNRINWLKVKITYNRYRQTILCKRQPDISLAKKNWTGSKGKS
jgi:UDP-glucuronate decarboxylase